MAWLLNKTESKFDDFISSALDWFWEMDPSGVYTYSSPQVENILGFTSDQIIGLTFIELMPLQEANPNEEIFQSDRMHTKPFTRLQSHFLHKNGIQVLLESSGSPYFDKDGKLAGVRGITRDITFRHTFDEEKYTYEELLALLDVPAIIANVDRLMVYVNPACERLMGYSYDELIGKPVSIFDCDRNSKEESVDSNMSKLEGRKSARGIRLRRAKDGSQIPVLISAKALFDEKGEVSRYFGFYTDMTDTLIKQSKLEQAVVDLRKGEERLSKIFESAPDPFAITRLSDGLIKDANEAFLKLFQFTKEEVLNKTTTDLNLWESSNDRGVLTGMLSQLNKVTNFETSGRRKNGSVFPVSGSATLIDLDDEQSVLVVMRDTSQ